MYSTPSRSSASRIMSAPVNLCGGLLFPRNEEAPASRSGAFAIYLAVCLARACPRRNANKAQETKYEEAKARGVSHVRTHMLTSKQAVPVVARAQISPSRGT